ncbi:MAG: L,D-transpeptidase family protein [Pseudoramibacter sp. EUB1.1]|uniref:L,D-transpeptidase family protein n=1 Tax=Candidatus Pseudoramibacter fermentans TaxID=2594427 RepID=A0A6L5GTN8_9FIRM|nr:L,D-transpeptidase family protein [Candidatus Pseudoramibacter fermentans]
MSQENEKKGGLFERTDREDSPKVKPAFDEDVRQDDVTTDDGVTSKAPAEAATEDAGEAKDPTEVVNERLRERSFEIAESEDDEADAASKADETPEAAPKKTVETAADAIDAMAAEVEASEKAADAASEPEAASEEASKETSEDAADAAETEAAEPEEAETDEGKKADGSAESKLAAEIDEVFAAKSEAEDTEAAEASADETTETPEAEVESDEEQADETAEASESEPVEADVKPADETTEAPEAEADKADEASSDKTEEADAAAPQAETVEAAAAEAAESAADAEEKAEPKAKKSKQQPKSRQRKAAPKVKIVGIAIAAIAIIYAAFAVYFNYHFFPNTAINGLAASGKTVSAISSSVENRADTYSVELKGRKGETEKITATALGLKYQGKKRVQQILSNQNGFAWPAHLFSGTKSYSAISYDKDKIDYLVRNLFQVSGSQVEAARNAQPVYKDGKIVIEDQISGSTVDQTKLKKLLINAIAAGDSTINLKKEDCYVQPKYTSSSKKVKQAAAKMRKMIKAEITYTFGSDKVVIDKSVFGPWLTVDDNMNVTVDQTQLKQYLYDLAYKTNTYYGKHTFKTTGGSTITVNGGNYGWRIDRDAEAKNLTQEIEAGKVITRDPEYSKKGKVRNSTYDDIGDSYVEVSISDQHMWVYKDGKKVVDTAVVTGDVTKGNGTTPGAYYIAYKERHATLKGEGYSTPVSYWMPFNGGQGIHDSYWRGAYGGTIYRGNGSHGCVNTPPAQVALVWDNVSQGTPVIVY